MVKLIEYFKNCTPPCKWAMKVYKCVQNIGKMFICGCLQALKLKYMYIKIIQSVK